MLWFKRGDAVEKIRGGGEGRCSLWYGKRKLGGVLSIQVDLQITSKVRLVVLYYINFATGADLLHGQKLDSVTGMLELLHGSDNCESNASDG